MSQTLSLYRLQQVDSQIDRAQSRLSAIQKILEDDAALRQANEQAKTAETMLQSAETALRQAEVDVKAQKIKIEQNESTLYSGTVHNPKELQDLQNDVAALKRHLSTLEDRLLEAMIAVDEAAAASKKAQLELQAAQNQSAEQNQGLHLEQATLQKEIDKVSTQRLAITSGIPENFLAIYDNLRQQRRGVAVSAISENSCSSCGSSLSAAQIQVARSASQMAYCPSCGRILYGT
jgi:predicted  nucleic acid-binding Zn-ribbon protein